ncbi:YrbL family protein [Vibrio atypicus]|uniref:YrbL family protein n=1 Tax=Vibrio atypicus TaxID=558271 RepID=UPI001357DB19|nr:YrbL family protein [Vibrio atypicus]
MSIVVLSDELLLGSGNERRCYVHPNDTSLCIKVNHPNVIHRSQNKIEEYYFLKLKKRSVPFTYIPEFYGASETNLGRGLVFERVQNSDGSPSAHLIDLLKDNTITKAEATSMLNQLYQYLIRFGISLGDINADQIVVRQNDHQLTPIIIDGIGTRRFGLKLILLANFPFLARRKVKKNWPVLLKKLSL